MHLCLIQATCDKILRLMTSDIWCCTDS